MSIFNSLSFESNWFIKQTNLLNTSTYTIPTEELSKLKNDFNFQRVTLPNKQVNVNFAYERMLQRCFKKCNSFVLEDWIDYEELDCTLKCAAVSKQGFELL